MAIRYTLLHTSNGANAEMPSNAAIQYAGGTNVPGGDIDEFIFTFTGTKGVGLQPVGDFANSISNLRLTLNGQTFFNFQAGYNNVALGQASQLGYLLNSMGPGRNVEVASSTTATSAFLRVPCGRRAPNSVGRLEYSISYAALAQTMVAAGAQFQIWARYNDNYQTSVTVGQGTTLAASATQQQVVIPLPAGVPGTLAGIQIMSNNITDTDITSVSVLSQSEYSLTQNFWRMLNGDMNSGVEFANATVAAAELATDGVPIALQRSQLCPGTLFIPTYGLTLNGDIRILLTMAVARTMQFLPVITAPAGARSKDVQSQTQAVKSNVARSVLDASDSLV